MIYRVQYTERAKKDLDLIYSDIAYRLLAPASALSIYKQIISMIDSLTCFPYRFRECENINVKPRWRICLVKKYNIYYKIDDIRKVVSITRIIYGGMNIDEQLND